MSLDTIYADDLDASVKRWAANPGPAPQPGFVTTAAVKGGVPQGALEFAGSVSDMLSAFGTASAASLPGAGGMFSVPSEDERKQQEAARQRMLHGSAWDFTQGNQLRAKAESFSPDPLTSSAADQVLNGLVRFGTKAAALIGLGGPAGAIPLGLDEGNTEAQRLRAQGVDDVTAAKEGAVTGVLSAAGAVVPLGGKTWLQTFGLIGVGGPGSYMAQEHLSRRILENAGQYDLASLHNPFDPLGLSLSTLIPGAFGALHMRGEYARRADVTAGRVPLGQLRPDELRSLKYDDPRLDAYASKAAEANGVPPALLLAIKNAGEKSGPAAVSAKGATGVMQFMKGTADELGLKDRTDPVASIDAGARYLKKLYDAYGSWDAAVAHYNGGGTQAVIVRGGGRPTYNETAGYLDRVRAYMAQHVAKDAAQDPAVVDAARVRVLNDTTAASLPDTPDAHAQMQRAEDVVAESGGRAAEAEIAPAAVLEPEVQRARTLVDAIDAGGVPLNPARLRAVAEDLGLEVRRDAAPEDTIARIREAVARAEDRVAQVPSADSPHVAWMRRSLQATEDRLEALGVPRPAAAPPKPAEPRPQFDAQGEPIGYSYDDLSVEERADFDRRHGIAPGRREENDVSLARVELQNLQTRVQAAEFGDTHFAPFAHGSETAADVLRTAEGDLQVAQLKLQAAQLRERIAKAPMQPHPIDTEALRQRDADNALPPGASVTLAGDEPAKRGAEVGGGMSLFQTSDVGGKNDQGAGAASRETSAAASPAATLDQQIAQKLATEKPDLQVVLPGSDERLSVADAMKRIAEEEKQDGEWADLVRVAAECALGA